MPALDPILQEDLAGKPDNIKEKIVAGRLSKKFESKALMNQTWLKDEAGWFKRLVPSMVNTLANVSSSQLFLAVSST